MLSCSVCIVCYNPTEKQSKNILEYTSLFSKVYVIDNSDKDNSSLFNGNNMIYIVNYCNAGIAKALNIGCKRALEDGFDYIMTMDQDSYWDIEQLRKYLGLIEEHRTELCVSFIPNRITESSQGSILGDVKHLIKKSRDSTIDFSNQYVDREITSGNVINLHIWKKVKGFNEDFFIDEVDFDFCFKLREAGYKILKLGDVFMEHTLGNPQKTFYPCVSYHRKERIYYIVRNMLYMKKLHPEYSRLYHYNKMLSGRFRELLFNFRIIDMLYFFRGFIDARKGIVGKYESRKSSIGKK